jgi:hypothetical protein
MENTSTLPDATEQQSNDTNTNTTATPTTTTTTNNNSNTNTNSTNREVKRYKVRSKTEDSVLAHSSAITNTESNENGKQANESADNGEVVIMSIQERLVLLFILLF